MPLSTDPGTESGGSREVGKEEASIFYVSYNQFLSGAF